MYGRMAVVGNRQTARVVWLPYEQREAFEAEQWQNALRDGEQLVVSTVPIALYLADWLIRVVEAVIDKTIGNASNAMRQCLVAVKRQLNAIGISSDLHWIRYAYKTDAGSLHGCEAAAQLATQAKEQVLDLLKGRKLLYDEWLSVWKHQASSQTSNHQLDLQLAFRDLLLHGQIRLRSAVEWTRQGGKSDTLLCLRCYDKKLTRSEHYCPYCGERCYYCHECLQMGRARTCSVLIVGQYHSVVPKSVKHTSSSPERMLDLAEFGLSDAQQMATKEALSFVHGSMSADHAKRRRQTSGWLPFVSSTITSKLSRQFLLWAVTGAGKTEMIFPLVAYVIRLGGRVLLATPRRDVVLELSPRLHKAFPELSIVTLYGGSEQRWEYGQLVIATTHQLMRFQKAFDLVIIDELDAFPYHGDERLYRVAEQCSTEEGVRLLLSATPPAYLQRELNRGRLAYVKLPVRYHRHPLPVPIRVKTPLVAEQIKQGDIPSLVYRALKQSLQEDAQIFVFLQRIAHTEAYAQLLRARFPHVPIEATSSKDEQRSEKVMAFRKRDIRILVTTTILERGVTVPRSHVYICDAEAELFDEASLVQMAGRAGRSGDAPNGSVYFLSQQWNESQRKAIKQINSMNELADKMGYLLKPYKGAKGRGSH